MQKSAPKQIARWVALAALFAIPFTPLIVANNYFFPFITGKAFFFRIAVEVAFAAWAVLALADKKYRPQWTWISVIFVVFVAWMFIADLFAVNPAKAFWSNFERMEGWITLIHLLAFFVVASTVLRVEQKWRAWWYTSIIAATYVIAYGLMQLAGLAQIQQSGVRLDSTLGNATYLAVYMLFHVFIAGWLAFTTERRWLRYGLFAFAAFAAWILFSTATRGTILGLIGGLLLAALLTALLTSRRTRRIATGAIVFILLVAGGFWMAKDSSFVRHDPVLTRIASISLAQGQTRFTIWHMAWEGFLARPVVGWGQEGFNYVFNQYYEPSLYAQEQWFDRAHNEFIDWLVAGGLPAFLLYLSLFVSALWILWRAPFARVDRIAFTALLAGYAFHNMFVFDNLTSYICFIAVLALIDGAAGKPIPTLMRAPEISPESTNFVAWPVSLALLLAVVFWIDAPGMAAASGLITAIEPTQNNSIAGNITAFEQLTAHPSFANQEVCEQLLTFAMQYANDQAIPTTQRQQIADLAITQMVKEVALIPHDARLRFELAVGYASFGDMKDALAQVEIARALSPDKETIIIEEGVMRLEAGDTAGAIRDFKTVYALAPQFPELATYAAAADVLSGNLPAAQSVLQKSFATTTVDSPILLDTYAIMKQYPPIIAVFKERVLKKGSSANDGFRLAVAYAQNGQRAQAIATVRATVALYPSESSIGTQLISDIQQGKIPS